MKKKEKIIESKRKVYCKSMIDLIGINKLKNINNIFIK